MIALTSRLIFPALTMTPREVPWGRLIAAVGLSVAILAVGGSNGSNWVSALVIASAAVGRSLPTLRLVVLGAAFCTAAGITVYLIEGIPELQQQPGLHRAAGGGVLRL